MTSKSERSPAQHKDFAPCVLNIDVHKQRAKSGHTKKKKKNKRTRQLEPVRVSGSKNKTDRTSFHLPHIFSPPICNFFFPQNDEEEEQEKNHFFINIRVRYLFAQREMKCPLDGRQSDESGTNRVTRITSQFLLVSK